MLSVPSSSKLSKCWIMAGCASEERIWASRRLDLRAASSIPETSICFTTTWCEHAGGRGTRASVRAMSTLSPVVEPHVPGCRSCGGCRESPAQRSRALGDSSRSHVRSRCARCDPVHPNGILSPAHHTQARTNTDRFIHAQHGEPGARRRTDDADDLVTPHKNAAHSFAGDD